MMKKAIGIALLGMCSLLTIGVMDGYAQEAATEEYTTPMPVELTSVYPVQIIKDEGQRWSYSDIYNELYTKYGLTVIGYTDDQEIDKMINYVNQQTNYFTLKKVRLLDKNNNLSVADLDIKIIIRFVCWF